MKGFKWRNYLCFGLGSDVMEAVPLSYTVQPRDNPVVAHENTDTVSPVLQTELTNNVVTAEGLKSSDPAGSTTNAHHSRIDALTSNASLVLGVVEEIVQVFGNVPYLESVAAVIKGGVNVFKETNECKEKWKDVQEDIVQMEQMLKLFKSHLPTQLPTIIDEGFKKVESCLNQVEMAKNQYQDLNTFVTILRRGALSNEAQSHIVKIKNTLQYLQTHLIVDSNIGIHRIERLLGNSKPGQQNQGLTVSEILKCPSPSQHFVGRQVTLEQLARIFPCALMTISCMNQNLLDSFVEHLQIGNSLILLDGTSRKALHKSLTDMGQQDLHSLKTDSLLLLQNADPSLVSGLENYLPTLPCVPMIVTSPEPIQNELAPYSFEVHDPKDPQLMNTIQNSVKKLLNPGLHVATIVAGGGTGKTQVVLEFVKQNHYRFSNIWFFDATSDASLTADFKELGKAAGVGEELKNVQVFLENTSHNWLCIFDNADDKNVDLSKYIPRRKNANVIITSRLLEMEQIASPGCHIEVSDLDKEDAIKLLLEHAHMESSDTSRKQGFNIVEAFNYHALAVSSAGAYIHAFKTCTLSNYLSILKSKQKELLKYQMKSLDGYSRSVFSAFLLSFEKLSTQAQHLLQMCSFLHHTSIPVQLFVLATTYDGPSLHPGENNFGLDFLNHFLSLFPKESSWIDTVDELTQLSLATFDNSTKALSLHTVIHACAHETVAQKDEERTMRAVTLLLGQATPMGGEMPDYTFRRQLLPHANHIQMYIVPPNYVYHRVRRILWDAGFWTQCEDLDMKSHSLNKKMLKDHHSDTLTSMANLGMSYHYQGKFEAAQNLEEEVLELRKMVFGKHHPDTLSSMANLGLTYYQQGKFDAAERLEQEALELRQIFLGKHHPDTLSSMDDLGLTYHAQGKFEVARKVQEQVVQQLTIVLGKHHPVTLNSMGNLGHTYHALGKFEASEKLKKEVVELKKLVLGEHHPDTLATMGGLGLTYYAQSKFEAAEKLDDEVLELNKKVLGKHHPNTLISMGNLASAYRAQGKFNAAVKLEEELLEHKKIILGKHHPTTLISMGNLGLTYHNQGRFEAAQKLEEEVLEMRQIVLGKHHPDTLISMGNLGHTYHAQGKFDMAQKLEEEVLEVQQMVLGEHHPDTLLSLHSLGVTYLAQGNLNAAEKLNNEGLEQCKRVLEKQHPYTLAFMANLASIKHAQGKFEVEEKILEEVLELRKDVLGEHHPDTLSSMANLGCLYHQQGKFEASGKLQREVLELRRKVLQDQHPDTLQSISDLGATYYKQDQFEVAEKLAEEVLEKRKEILGKYHPDTLESILNLAITYRAQGKFEAAQKLKEEEVNLRKEIAEGVQSPV